MKVDQSAEFLQTPFLQGWDAHGIGISQFSVIIKGEKICEIGDKHL